MGKFILVTYHVAFPQLYGHFCLKNTWNMCDRFMRKNFVYPIGGINNCLPLWGGVNNCLRGGVGKQNIFVNPPHRGKQFFQIVGFVYPPGGHQNDFLREG